MKKLLLPIALLFVFTQISLAQNVGIGTVLPTARLHVTDSSVVFSANGAVPVAQGDPPISGSGRRAMWYADKAAFRAGYTSNDNWDKAKVGNYSFACGHSTLASGIGAVAVGWGTTASGDYSFAAGYASYALGENSTSLGYTSIASGYSSIASGFFANASGTGATAMGIFSAAGGAGATAFGDACTAHGNGSTAMGKSTHADANNATAMGYLTNASGINSTAMGYASTASGVYSTAIGVGSTASGYASTVIGNFVSTTNFNGAFAIGDNSTTTVMQSFVANGFRSRFAGGYRLLTNADATLGVVLTPNDNSWGAVSDRNLKENFLPVDGEIFLKKIAAMPLTTWNYKAQHSKTFRHYGPMAQDFFAAFGKDELGVIGCDTLINQQDFLGVNLIAIQALEKRTAELKKEIDELKKTNKDLEARLEKLEGMMRGKL